MPSRPIHRRNTSTPQKQPVDVGPLAQALGVLSVGFGVGLMVLTLAGAADGYAAIGLYDIMVGSMFVAFSYKAIRFGYDVVTGRQTIYGEWA
jgi:hypothetical protein